MCIKKFLSLAPLPMRVSCYPYPRMKYGWWFRNPVNSPVEVGSLYHYLQGFIHVRWLFGISEPSTASCEDHGFLMSCDDLSAV